jgi:UDPglucose 6-dehydrogenase
VGHFGGNLSGRSIALWGLSFKPRTDDMREAPSLSLIAELLNRGVRVIAHDPAAMEQARRILGKSITLANDPYEACKGADALCIVTEWIDYAQPNFARLRSLLANPVIFDGRNVYEPKRMKEAGFTHYSIGRPTVQPE